MCVCVCAFAKEKYCVSLRVLKKRENAHISIWMYIKTGSQQKKKNTRSSPLAVCLNVLEMKLDFDAHEKKNKWKKKQMGDYL